MLLFCWLVTLTTIFLLDLQSTRATSAAHEGPCEENSTGNASCSSTNTTSGEADRTQQKVHLVYAIIALSIVTLLLDLLSAVIWKKRCHSGSEFFLFIMSLYDFLHSLFRIVECILILNKEHVSRIVYYIVDELVGVTFNGMTFSYTSLVVERHFAATSSRRDPFKRIETAETVSCAVLALLLIVATPNLIASAAVGRYYSLSHVYYTSMIIALRLAPWCVLMVFNVLLYLDMRKQREIMRNTFLRSVGSGISLSIAVQTGASTITYPVAQIWRLVRFLSGESRHDMAPHIISCLELLHHVVNFLVYITLVRSYRGAVGALLCKCQLVGPGMSATSIMPMETLMSFTKHKGTTYGGPSIQHSSLSSDRITGRPTQLQALADRAARTEEESHAVDSAPALSSETPD